jgi:hypothetical protein
VTRSPRQDRRELFDPREHAGADVAQPFDPEERRRFERLATAHGVGTARVRVRYSRIDHDDFDQRRKRQPLHGQRPRIEEQRFTVAPQARGHLVHDSDRCSHELRFDGLRHSCQFDVIDVEAQKRAQRTHQADFQSGARRYAGAERNRRLDAHVESGDLHAMARQGCGDTLNVVQPVAPARFVPGFVLQPVGGERGARCADTPVAAALHVHLGSLRDDRWKHVAVVIVGVLAH